MRSRDLRSLLRRALQGRSFLFLGHQLKPFWFWRARFLRPLNERPLAPYLNSHCVRWLRRFLSRPATSEPLLTQVRRFSEELERDGTRDWQVRQAEQAVRIYFVNFLRRADWRRQPGAAPEAQPRTDPLALLDPLRRRLRTRHHSYRTEFSYVDWVRRFPAYLLSSCA